MQSFLIELYPDCCFRSDDISLNNTFTIAAGNNHTYYSTNNVTICSNDNIINVNSGGHLLVKAGNKIHIKNGFHAKAGSNVHLKIESPCSTITTTALSAPQRIAPNTPLDDTYSTDEVATSNNLENIESDMIQSTSIYTISGQLVRNIEGELQNTSDLPNGMYILQHRISDGSIISTKITK